MPSQNITASTQITSQPGTLERIVVNSHSGGTFKLVNGTASQTALGGTYTPATGSSSIEFEPLGFNTGLYVAVGGTADLTVVYNERQPR